MSTSISASSLAAEGRRLLADARVDRDREGEGPGWWIAGKQTGPATIDGFTIVGPGVGYVGALDAAFIVWAHNNADAILDALDAVEVVRADEAMKDPPKHRYWRAGEPDCPREIKAGNGELHTRRCKVCGQDDPRSQVCFAAIGGIK